MIRDRVFFGRKTSSFTLQWHLTNACPNHCLHCYDRSNRQELPLDKALEVLNGFAGFCRQRRVQPQISLSGGDPFLYPHFWDLYRTIALADIPVSILGNPVGSDEIQKLQAIQPPVYYQVSLEGLREHNDAIRGLGHYERTLSFLLEARRLGLQTHVMLTLTRVNLDQVLPLGEALRGLTSRFTFNRLSSVGEAASLERPDRDTFVEFLKSYLKAGKTNPILGYKDNLFNVIRYRHRAPLFRGCTGHGCGAAFNFVALLPDGEVHACRKFSSRIGDIRQKNLGQIFDSEEAKGYRNGTLACRDCPLRKVCGGCLAVTSGRGLNPLKERDPDCFFSEYSLFLNRF